MQGVRGSTPLSSTATTMGNGPAGNPSGRVNPSKTPIPAGSRVRQARQQGIRDRRHLARDLMRPTPASAYPSPIRFERHRPLKSTLRAEYPVTGAWAARACGIAVVRIGRPAPLLHWCCLARRGRCLPRGGVVGHVACRRLAHPVIHVTPAPREALGVWAPSSSTPSRRTLDIGASSSPSATRPPSLWPTSSSGYRPDPTDPAPIQETPP